MDDLIQSFFENYLTEELRSQLYKALGLFTVYGLTTIHQELPDIILQEQEEHREVIVDQLVSHITGGLDSLFVAQRIRLGSEASIGYKTSFLEAIFAFSFREDYRPYQVVTEDWTLTNEEKLGAIIADVQGVDITEVMEHLEWVYDGTISSLVNFIKNKNIEEVGIEDTELLRSIRSNLKTYRIAFGTPASVEGLTNINMALGGSFQTYLELFKDAIVNLGDIEATTFNLMWLAMVSKEGVSNPQKFLLSVSETIFTDMQQQQIFSRMLQKAMGRYQEIKEHQK